MRSGACPLPGRARCGPCFFGLHWSGLYSTGGIGCSLRTAALSLALVALAVRFGRPPFLYPPPPTPKVLRPSLERTHPKAYPGGELSWCLPRHRRGLRPAATRRVLPHLLDRLCPFQGVLVCVEVLRQHKLTRVEVHPNRDALPSWIWGPGDHAAHKRRRGLRVARAVPPGYCEAGHRKRPQAQSTPTGLWAGMEARGAVPLACAGWRTTATDVSCD